MSAGTCRYCACTDAAGCEGGCGWADDTRTLCTRCELAFAFARSTLPVMVALAAKAPAEATTWDTLPEIHRRATVLAFRQLADAIREQFFDAIGEEATDAVVDLATLAGVLYQKFPKEMAEADAVGDPPVAVAIDLLEKAAESRILLT